MEPLLFFLGFSGNETYKKLCPDTFMPQKLSNTVSTSCHDIELNLHDTELNLHDTELNPILVLNIILPCKQLKVILRLA